MSGAGMLFVEAIETLTESCPLIIEMRKIQRIDGMT